MPEVLSSYFGLFKTHSRRQIRLPGIEQPFLPPVFMGKIKINEFMLFKSFSFSCQTAVLISMFEMIVYLLNLVDVSLNHHHRMW